MNRHVFGRDLGHSVLAIALVAAFWIPGPAHAEEWGGRITVEDGVTKVWNPAEPVDADLTWELEEMWRVGGYSDADEEIFGVIPEVLVDGDGNAYLLDQQLNEVKVFDELGVYLRTLGREGEGPGEFKMPMTMIFLQGDRLAVVNMMPARIAVLGLDGSAKDDLPLPQNEAGGFAGVSGAEYRGGQMVIMENTSSFADDKIRQTTRLLSLDDQGRENVVFGEHSTEMEARGEFVITLGSDDFARIWTLTPDGQLLVASDYGGYRWEVYAPDGKLVRTVDREYESVRYSELEMEAMRKQREQFEQQGGGVSDFFKEYRADIGRLFVRDNGEIWVHSSENGGLNQDLGHFDVFDSDGRFRCRVTPQVEYNNSRDNFVITRDRLVRIKESVGAYQSFGANFGGGGEHAEEPEEDPEPLEVISYRLPFVLE